MTGPEHYRQAEARLEAAYRISHPDSGHTDEDAITLVQIALQRAQVHATLAHAAAVIDTGNGTIKPSDLHEWRKATDEDYAAECAAEVTR